MFFQRGQYGKGLKCYVEFKNVPRKVMPGKLFSEKKNKLLKICFFRKIFVGAICY
jgi:hypothetical protein